jgi:hypothetical protein
MMTWFVVTPVLGAMPFEFWKIVIILLMVLGSTVLKKISDAREKAERAKAGKSTGKPPAAPVRGESGARGPDGVWATGSAEPVAAARRDNPHRNEIEQFLEEVGRRRPSSAPPARGEAVGNAAPVAVQMARQAPRPQPPQPTPASTQRTVGTSARVRPEPPKAAPLAAPQSLPLRPGAELAQRKAPVSDDLGAQVRAHLNQYLDTSRMSQRAKADLGTAVERAVRDHLGKTETRGTDDQDSLTVAAQPGTPIVSLLRNPAGVRTAVLVNEILQRPKCLRRKT